MYKILRTLKGDIKDAVKNIKDDANTAFKVKVEDIENTNIYTKYANKVTLEEAKRAQRTGLIAGLLIALFVVMFLIFGIGWLAWSYFT